MAFAVCSGLCFFEAASSAGFWFRDGVSGRRGYLEARKIQKCYPFWITLTSSKEVELREKIATSYKLKQDDPKHSERSL